MIGWVLLAGCRDWLLWRFALLWVPASSGHDAGWVVDYGAAIRIDERLACQIKSIKRPKSSVLFTVLTLRTQRRTKGSGTELRSSCWPRTRPNMAQQSRAERAASELQFAVQKRTTVC